MSASIGRRRFLAALPALAMSPRILAQSSPPPAFRANGLSQITLTVSDVARSLEFYQGLFGMPIQARQGSTVLLRIGNGPRFLALRQAAGGERPSISALGIGVQDFSLVGHASATRPRSDETGYSVRRRWRRGRLFIGAGSPFSSWTRSPASTPYCDCERTP